MHGNLHSGGISSALDGLVGGQGFDVKLNGLWRNVESNFQLSMTSHVIQPLEQPMLGWDAMWRCAGFILDESPPIWIFSTTFPLTAFSVVHLLDRCPNLHYHTEIAILRS